MYFVISNNGDVLYSVSCYDSVKSFVADNKLADITIHYSIQGFNIMFTLKDLCMMNQQLRSASIVHGKKLDADIKHTNRWRQLKSGVHSQSLRKGKFNQCY